jgi:hypothetical protein
MVIQNFRFDFQAARKCTPNFMGMQRSGGFSRAKHFRRLRQNSRAKNRSVFNPHVAMPCPYFLYHNFCRVHQTLRVTPAMEAAIADHVWHVKDSVALLPAIESKPRGPYKKTMK